MSQTSPTVEVTPILTDVMDSVEEAFTKSYVDLARARYPTKNVVVVTDQALIGRDFDDFKETQTFEAGTPHAIHYTCIIFTSGTLQYLQGPKGPKFLRFAGNFKQIDDVKTEFFEITEEAAASA